MYKVTIRNNRQRDRSIWGGEGGGGGVKTTTTPTTLNEPDRSEFTGGKWLQKQRRTAAGADHIILKGGGGFQISFQGRIMVLVQWGGGSR